MNLLRECQDSHTIRTRTVLSFQHKSHQQPEPLFKFLAISRNRMIHCFHLDLPIAITTD